MAVFGRRYFSTINTLGAKIDWSRFPSIEEEDLEEKFVKGGGPGGQSVNKTTNAVFLRHIPTGVWVKCHESRSLVNNQKIARKLLLNKLDNTLNGEESVESQKKRIEAAKRELKREKTRAKYEQRKAEKEVAQLKMSNAQEIPDVQDHNISESDINHQVDKQK